MATFIPTLESIENGKYFPPEPGELALLEELRSLPDDYIVYFQPHINSYNPDVVLLHPRKGIAVIEVKDWNLSLYEYRKDPDNITTGYMLLQSQPEVQKSTPFEQVLNYRDELSNFFQCCTKSGLENIYASIAGFLFFYNARKVEIEQKFECEQHGWQFGKFENPEKKGKTYFFGRDNLPTLACWIDRLMNENSPKFRPYAPSFFEKARSFFALSQEWASRSEPLVLDKRQTLEAQYDPNRPHTRIKGVAGSGKTLIVAQKAINCFKSTHNPVLILCYNISLINYLRDRIAQGTRDMSNREREKAFWIYNFDQWLVLLCDLLDIRKSTISNVSNEQDWENWRKNIMNNVSIMLQATCKVPTFCAVLVDEAQDYKTSWFQFLLDNFVAIHNATFFVVADEKQDIYSHVQLDDNKLPVTPGIRGRWGVLTKSYRLPPTVIDLASKFQKKFLSSKYIIDTFDSLEMPQQLSFYDDIRYMSVKSSSDFWTCITDYIQSRKISPNDVCIISGSIKTLQEVESMGTASGYKFSTVFESLEEAKEIEHKYNGLSSNHEARRERDKIRSQKKHRFNMNAGTMKLCTIQSFKGWEIDTVVLLLDSSLLDLNSQLCSELVYVAITRAKRNLLILDFGNCEDLSSFFNWYFSMQKF